MESFTVRDLKSIAKELGLKNYSKLKRIALEKVIVKRKKEMNKYKHTYKGIKTNPLNKFFNRIFIINLKGKNLRFYKVAKQLQKHGIKYNRFEAVDGRCKEDECKDKKKELERKYRVKISRSLNAPASSLVIGTILILREMVRKRWESVLICEDDIVLGPSIIKRFKQGILELEENEIDWDLLYLGCGNYCGHRGVSDRKTKQNKYKTGLRIVSKEYDWHVSNKDDLRLPCDECEYISPHLSYASSPGGTWCYAYSLKGAKKLLKLMKGKISNHIDQIIIKYVSKGKLTAVSFDPPIVWHEAGAFRPDSDIPWSF